MVNRVKGFFTNNYFENAEITKVELFLLIAVILIFLPFVYSDLDDRFDRFFGKYEPIKKTENEQDYTVTIGEFSLPKLDYDAIKENINKSRVINKLGKLNENKMDEAIYKHLKSPENQVKIYAVFIITMAALIVTVILSRKGYTSYTPWLEKLANDKLTFDLQLYQHIEMRQLKEFYRNTFRVSNEVATIEDKQVVGWKPVDENVKWYSVFSEKLDYRLYELAFEKLWAEWCEDNYNIHRNADGEYEPKYNRRRQLYDNPELVPNMSNLEIKEELEKKRTDIQSELDNKIEEIRRLEESTKQVKSNSSNYVDEAWLENLSKINNALTPINEQIEKTNYLKGELRGKIKRFETLKGVLEESSTEEVFIRNEKLSEISKEWGTIGVQYVKDKKEIELEIKEYNVKEELLIHRGEEEYNFHDKVWNIRIEQQNLQNQLKRQKNKIKESFDELEYIETLKGVPLSYTEAINELFAKLNEVKQTIDNLNEAYDGFDNSALQNEQKKLEKKKRNSKITIENLKDDEVKNFEKDIKEKQFKIRKLESRLALMKDHNVRDNETCLDIIINQMNIFREGAKKDKIKKILIRKFQNDVLYYAVMINFRRGLQNATTKWLEADESLKRSEEEVIETQADQRDVASRDLEETVMSIIDDIQNQLRNDATKKNGSSNSTDSKNQESEVSKKIEQIQEKLTNRNNWETPEWRAMGSIYYKWREDGKEDKDQDDGIEKAEMTFSEKRRKWINKYFRKITEESKSDPTEVAWAENRTVRAVHSLSKSFGFDESGGTGKAIIFFGVVFALIIGTALTNSLDIVIETMQLPENCDDCFHVEWFFLKSNYSDYQYVIILLLCFFPLGILFYHQGVIFLSANASEELTLGNKPLIFVNFIVILIQGIVVYFLAASIGDVNAFLSLVMLLVFVDAVWVSIFTWNDLRDEVRDSPVYLEWIIFDIIIGLFAWAFSIYYASSPDPDIYGELGWMQNTGIFMMLLIAFSTRAIVDYTYGWKNFWSKFADAE